MTDTSNIFEPYHHPSAWIGADMRERQDWIVELSEQDNAALLAAVRRARTRDLAIPNLHAQDFDLGPLSARLFALRDTLINGAGFVLLRGFQIDAYSLQDAALAYWGIGMHLGRGAAQNAQGDLLGHVTDLGVDYRTDRRARGYQTRLTLPFHNDAMDVVGLLCVNPARQGGESRIVSSTTLHNELLRRRPDLMPIGYADFHIDRRDEAPAGKPPCYSGPLFSRLDGRLFCRYNRGYIESAQRLQGVPRLTAQQHELLDLIDAMCNDETLQMAMMMQRGDMQFLSNYTVLHARGDYEDWPDAARRRHLLRLWLDTGLIPRMPPSFMDRYEDMREWQRHPRPPIFDLSAVHADLAH